MKINIQKVMRFVVPVFACLALVVCMALPSYAAELDQYTPSDITGYTIADYFASVDVSNSSVVGNLDFNDSYTWVRLDYYRGDTLMQWINSAAVVANYDFLNITASSDSRLIWQLIPSTYYRSSGGALLPIQGVQNGMQLYIDMTVGADVPTNASYNSFRIQFVDSDGYSVGQQMGTYSRSKINGLWHYYGNYTFSIPEGAVAWQCFFFYDRTGAEIQTTFDVDMHINIATLTMTNEQYEDIKSDDSDIVNGTPDMGDIADGVEGDAADKNDQMNDAIAGATPDKPNVDDVPMDYDSIVDKDASTTINNTFKIITDNGIITPMLLSVVIIMVIGYVLYGKK